MKSYAVHYMNKYPKGKVDFTEDKLNAYDAKGDLVVALRRGGNGQIMDLGPELGAVDRHDLSPLPKNARVFKLYTSGKIGPSEEAAPRAPVADQLAVDGRVPSIEECKEAGLEVDRDGIVALAKKAE